MIPHIVEFHRVTVDVHALLPAGQHQQTPHEMKRRRPTEPAAPSCPILYANKGSDERTYLRTRSCRIWSRNLDGDWRSIIFRSPFSSAHLLPTSLEPPTLLESNEEMRRKTRRDGTGTSRSWREAARSDLLRTGGD
ncbi:hypothetical protein PR202_ga10278 [Eleusine coracana subsp. coracana]|uniref:Uncharacterized protein n=1 Tax=Eleusine coracana subsp. coracana TaxID=191504 RepID=A0AAV5C6A6_ELECO|nr:hypothetical protein PR202_ga10278 [Eleusine coracana subsp. coracana]